jgi:hypothetical protein
MYIRASALRTTCLLIVIWTLLAGYYVYMGDWEALLLWVVLPIPFGFMLLYALRSRHIVLSFFMAGIFLSHAVLPSFFFLERENYTFSGWTAVKNFDFNVSHFLQIYTFVFFYVAIVLIVTLVFKQLLFRSPKPDRAPFQRTRGNSAAHQASLGLLEIVRLSLARFSAANPRTKLGYSLLFAAIILLAAILNNWMYSRGIGMTGLLGSQQALPFRLNGILYYSTRFLLPVILALVYMRTSRSWPLAALALFYALWAGTSQISRTTYTLLLLPIVAFAFLDRRYFLMTFALSFFLVAYPWVGYARNSIYYVVDNVVYGDTSIPLYQLIQQTIVQHSFDGAFSSFFSVLARVGGAQDVILAAQYDTEVTGGSLREFQRVFLFGSPITGDQVQAELYGFIPPEGFSAGAGGLSSMVLQIAGGNLIVLFFVAVWLAVLLTVGEVMARRYVRKIGTPIAGYFFGSVYVLFLYAFGHIEWLYGFTMFAIFILLVLRVSGLSTILRRQLVRKTTTNNPNHRISLQRR